MLENRNVHVCRLWEIKTAIVVTGREKVKHSTPACNVMMITVADAAASLGHHVEGIAVHAGDSGLQFSAAHFCCERFYKRQVHIDAHGSASPTSLHSNDAAPAIAASDIPDAAAVANAKCRKDFVEASVRQMNVGAEGLAVELARRKLIHAKTKKKKKSSGRVLLIYFLEVVL